MSLVYDVPQGAWTSRMLLERLMAAHDTMCHTILNASVSSHEVEIRCSCGISRKFGDIILRNAGVDKKMARIATRNVPEIGDQTDVVDLAEAMVKRR